eukprot:CAMPEP_0203709638 /NCGR_PEP_ID=MMETSP0091-20130426/62389_1 /ASSEMBLY_ACC=CAM_ASM_001089 /TAXON_ID=426623 /ORGANISM="Chaetoceros affinis, Strain CCMP159" /LENGTH=35 /DNA_ID= /DNA_START= /DNA_END= /DNA_ORIENTATION=
MNKDHLRQSPDSIPECEGDAASHSVRSYSPRRNSR